MRHATRLDWRQGEGGKLLEELLKPHVKQMNLFKMFAKHDTYEVPVYQREYAWTTEQADALVKDLKEFSEDEDVSSYLLGQIIFSSQSNPENDGCHFKVVDGQQRLTSLYLLFLAMNALYKEMTAAGPDTEAFEYLSKLDLISYVTDEEVGQKKPRLVLPRLANTFLENLSNSVELPELDINPSQRNIRENYEHFLGYLRTNFSTLKELDDFTFKLLFRTLLTRVTLESEEEALDAFEKLNSRGLPLNSADLLKNLLFQNAKEGSEYDKISSEWDKTVQKMYGVWPKKAASPLYLMKSMLGEKIGDGLPMPKVYKGWREYMKKHNTPPLEFSADLLSAANFAAKVGVKEVKEETEELTASRYFKTVQHLPLVLAARKFHQEENYAAFRATCMMADARVALFLLAGEKANSFENGLWPVVQKIAKLQDPSAAQVYESFETFFKGEYGHVTEQMKFQMESWSYQVNRERIRQQFVLAVLTHALEKEAGKIGIGNSPAAYLEGRKGKTIGYDIDHIRPQKSIENLATEERKAHWINKIGNLTLLHSRDNASAGASKESEKSVLYRDQDLVLTKALASDTELDGFQSHAKKAVLGLRTRGHGSVDKWSEEASKEREQVLVDLLLSQLSYEGLASKIEQLEQ